MSLPKNQVFRKQFKIHIIYDAIAWIFFIAEFN